MINRRSYIVMIILLAFALFSCSPAVTSTSEPTAPMAEAPEATSPPSVEPTEAAPAEEEEFTVLRVGWLETIDSWNPHISQSFWIWGDLVYDFWMAKGSTPNCDPQPRVVESWDVSADGMTTTLQLAQGITFSDGTPFDAQAAADYLTWFASTPDLAPWFGTTLYLDSAEAMDETTVRITTQIPIGRSFVQNDGIFMYVGPLQVWKDVPEEQLFSFEAYPPIGTGPYTVTEWEPGSYVIFDAREDYFAGKPPIDRIVLQSFSNVDALVSAIKAGDIDLSPPRMPPETYDILVADPNLTVEERTATDKYNLNFNMSEFGVRHPAIADPVIREAIDYAIDRQAIIDVALLGHGALCPTNWACAPNMVDQINPELTVTPYNPDKAKQLLDDAGYIDRDGDGVREMEDGLPLEFRLNYQLEDPPQLTVTDMISDFLSEIGIAVEVQALEYGEMALGVLEERDFDLVLFNMYTDAFGPGGMDYSGSCWAAEAGANGRNYPGYCNEAVDDLVYTAWYSVDDKVFKDALFEAQAIVASDRPYITLAGINKIQAFRNDHFEFPFGICHESEGGMLSWMGVMNAEVK
jgi:peptide/nickel transport system substrate-binding protein